MDGFPGVESRMAIDTMDKWDEEKLRSVILSKQGNPRTTTEVQSPSQILSPLNFPLSSLLDCVQVFYRGRRVTKVRRRGLPLHSSARCSNREADHSHFSYSSIFFFRFGWFWQCPNGELCQYRHALPPGFVLKSQRKALEDAEKANMISLEEFLEVEVRPCTIRITAIKARAIHYRRLPMTPPHTHTRSDTNSART